MSGRFSATPPPRKRSSRPSLSLYLDFPLMSPLTLAACDHFPLSRPPLQVRVRAWRTASAAAETTTTTTTTAEVSVGVGVCVRVLLARRARTTAAAAAGSGFRNSRDFVSANFFASDDRSAAVSVRVFRPDPFVEFLVCSLVSFGRSISIWLAWSRSICSSLLCSAVLWRASHRRSECAVWFRGLRVWRVLVPLIEITAIFVRLRLRRPPATPAGALTWLESNDRFRGCA